MPFVFSTLTCDYAYTNFLPNPAKGQPRQIILHEDGFKEQIVIKGGANLSNDKFITPLGARTEVTERQLETLERNSTFQKHKKQHFILVRGDKADPDGVAREHMEPRDASAPYTPQSEIFRDRGEDTITPKVSMGDKIVGAVRRAIS